MLNDLIEDKDLLEIVKLIKQDEGFSHFVYKCPAGKLTIGYGRNLEDNGISKLEGEMMLINDISQAEKALPTIFDNYEFLTPSRKMVLISMHYNLGLNGLKKFKKMIKAIEDDNFLKASHEMLDSDWADQIGDRSIRLATIMKDG